MLLNENFANFRDFSKSELQYRHAELKLENLEKRLLDTSRSDSTLFSNFWSLLAKSKSNNVDDTTVVLICDYSVLGKKLKLNFVRKRNLRFVLKFFENKVIVDGLQS